MDAVEMKALFEKRHSFDNVLVAPGAMSPRERFFATMEYRKPDRIIDCEFGYWDNTLTRWHSEGLPKEVNSNEKADVFFGFDDWTKSVWVNCGLQPDFPYVTIEKGDRYSIIRDNRGVTCKVFTDGTDSIPHYLDFPIKDRDTYLPFKERLTIKMEERLSQWVRDAAPRVRNRNYVLSTFAGSTAGYIRDLMGFEGFSIATCMQPELIQEILDDMQQLYHAIAVALSALIDVDLVAWWEDIAFKTGPIVSPEFFLDKCGPVYKAAMDVYQAHGTKYSYVDCDGDNRLLVPTWLNNGVNIIFPLEVNAGVHPESLRERYPGIRMMGGFDKVVLLQGTAAIKRELLLLRGIVDEGGFIPHVDHRVQADVAYKDYLYYLEAKRDIFGIENRVLA